MFKDADAGVLRVKVGVGSLRMKTRRLNLFFARIELMANRPWYVPLAALLALVDAFIFVIPVEAILVPVAIVRKSRWFLSAFWISIGSAAGASLFAWCVGIVGPAVVERFFSGAMQSATWLRADRLIHAHGAWALGVFSVGILPQHIAVAAAGLAQVSILVVFLAVFFGRMVKYGTVAWCAVHAPRVLQKLRVL